MLGIQTLIVAVVLAMAAVHAHPVTPAPAYVRRARNATKDPECTAFLDTWDSCCDIQRVMTNYTTAEVKTANSTTATDNGFSNHSRTASQVQSTNQSSITAANKTNSDSSTNSTTTNSSSTNPTNTTDVTAAPTNVTSTSLSGVYNLNHYGPFSATYGYCDMESDGGGWLVIFRREENINFQRKLKEYEDGFGYLEAGRSFWYGLKALNHITNRGTWELRVDLVKGDDRIYAHYSSISIGDASEGYILRLGAYVAERSTASDSLQEFNGKMFFTEDNDGVNKCAKQSKGGWWFPDSCGGQRGGILTSFHNHLHGWYSITKGKTIMYDSTELKIRQRGCNV